MSLSAFSQLKLASRDVFDTVGHGSFGEVIQAKIIKTNEVVAIKKVLEDKKYKNRELQLIQQLDHPNICALKAYFYNNEEEGKFPKRSKKDKVYLNLVLEYMPETVYSVYRRYTKARQYTPTLAIKLYMYQLFRSLAYSHHHGICHRDIKPQNLLVNPTTGVLKLCDFGSAKPLVSGEANIAYICSRYYRAPELIFGAKYYTTSIDIWSVGCVLGEMMLGRPLFPGKSSIDQIIEIVKIRGTPTTEQLEQMNPDYTKQQLPRIYPTPLSKVFRSKSSKEVLDLLDKLLEYIPSQRITAIEAMAHPYFDELRQQSQGINASSFPPLFNFTSEELSIRPDLNSKLIPHGFDTSVIN
ncbi:unnamed protein product [Cunninghamella echinulata]